MHCNPGLSCLSNTAGRPPVYTQLKNIFRAWEVSRALAFHERKKFFFVEKKISLSEKFSRGKIIASKGCDLYTRIDDSRARIFLTTE
jgi:hypothetical protein